jgi:hypothetical protein
MPRYFFHFYDFNSKNLARDSEGAVFSGFRKAKNEAIGLARDIAELGVDRSTWQVLVIDENGNQVLRLPLSRFRPRKFRPWIDLVHRVATYEPRFRPGVFTWLLMAAVLAMAVQAAVLTPRASEPSRGRYHLASAEAKGIAVNVRFVPRTSIAEIEDFLQAYKATLVNGPLPRGFYRLRILDSAASPEELKLVVERMANESIISLVAVERIEGER